MSAVETTGLVKRFGMHAAVDGLDMTVPERSIYGFLGANGAGKTTTLRLVLGLLRANGGTIRIFGESIGRRAIAGVGALIEAPSLYPHLTGAENLAVTRRLLGLGPSGSERVLELVDLSRAAGKRPTSPSRKCAPSAASTTPEVPPGATHASTSAGESTIFSFCSRR